LPRYAVAWHEPNKEQSSINTRKAFERLFWLTNSFLLALWTCWGRQDRDSSENPRVSVHPDLNPNRGGRDRDQGHFLFPTNAYQLALKVPGLRVSGLTTTVDSFRCLSPRLSQHSNFVIVDELDECHNNLFSNSYAT
jgi:hypothetical protein